MLLLTVVFGIPAPAQSVSKNLLFFEDFEGKQPFSGAHRIETGDWDYALNYVEKPVFRGKKAARFEIREGQELVHNGVRAEVTIIKGLPSRNMWYSFAVYFPSDGYATDSQREVICQWYQDGTPATSFRGRNDRLLLDSGNDPEKRIPYDLGPIVKDQWTEVVFHFIHSYKEDGLVEVWINGNLALSRKGGNMYDDVLPKWKVGLYKASFKYHNSDVNRRLLFFDNIRVGGPGSTLQEMLPGGK